MSVTTTLQLGAGQAVAAQKISRIELADSAISARRHGMFQPVEGETLRGDFLLALKELRRDLSVIRRISERHEEDTAVGLFHRSEVLLMASFAPDQSLNERQDKSSAALKCIRNAGEHLSASGKGDDEKKALEKTFKDWEKTVTGFLIEADLEALMKVTDDKIMQILSNIAEPEYYKNDIWRSRVKGLKHFLVTSTAAVATATVLLLSFTIMPGIAVVLQASAAATTGAAFHQGIKVRKHLRDASNAKKAERDFRGLSAEIEEYKTTKSVNTLSTA